MEERKFIQIIQFDNDLVVFVEGSDDQQRQVNIYGYAMHQAVNVWDFVEWLCTRAKCGRYLPEIPTHSLIL